MSIYGMGLRFPDGAPLFPSLDEGSFTQGILSVLHERGKEVASFVRAGSAALRMEMQRQPLDDGDALTRGWTYLVGKKDPQIDSLVEIVQPLAEHRKMRNPTRPLLFDGEAEDMWSEWVSGNFAARDQFPGYVLIIGGPDQVPFRFQSFLSILASVGRVDFDSPSDLQRYVEKVITLERASEPKVKRECVVFAPDAGPEDATHFSHHYMAEPLAEHIRELYQLQVTAIMAEQATREQLLASLRNSSPALVYIASHGIGAAGKSLDIQKRLNGAICCQAIEHRPPEEWLFAAKDAPEDEPFLEGSVFFQFGCYTYGTPARSDFSHWREGESRTNAEQDFTAALPKRLLSNPRGPIAFIGHVDMAWVPGVENPDNLSISSRWHRRLEPYLRAISMLLEVQPCGLALREMTRKCNVLNGQLVNTWDSYMRGDIAFTEPVLKALSDTFIARNDAQNYMLFGDPATRLRIPVT